MKDTEKYAHFKGKEAIEHVVEAQATGLTDSAEIHGTELPGYLSAATDAAREAAVILLFLQVLFPGQIKIFLVFSLGWLLWKAGRSALLGWSRLERLHRILEQERWEIEHHRQQERDELGELYAAKGFEGQLLEDVLDVLMADNDRLLRVMVEEELGLTLESQEHPLKQALGAALGTVVATALCLLGLIIYPTWGLPIASFLTVAIAAAGSAYYIRNALISAVVWNIGIAGVAYSAVYFLIDFFLRGP